MEPKQCPLAFYPTPQPLRPCPFCKSLNLLPKQGAAGWVECNGCGACGPDLVDWNSRPLEDALPAIMAEYPPEHPHPGVDDEA